MVKGNCILCRTMKSTYVELQAEQELPQEPQLQPLLTGCSQRCLSHLSVVVNEDRSGIYMKGRMIRTTLMTVDMLGLIAWVV